MKSVTIIYTTARMGGIDILRDSMQRQTHKPKQIIICDALYDWRYEAVAKYMHGLPVLHLSDPPKRPGDYWNLSKAWNRALATIDPDTCDLVCLLQDYIWLPDDAIARFVERCSTEGEDIAISGVGHQYLPADDVHVSFHPTDTQDRRISIFSHMRPPCGDRTFTDPRLEKRGWYLCNPIEWEANWACFPTRSAYSIGGFDEDFDAGWGYDNVNFSERLQLSGCPTFVDGFNESRSYSHIELFKEKTTRDAAPNNQDLWHRKYRDFHKGSKNWRSGHLHRHFEAALP